MENAKTVMKLLKNFEGIYGLSVNFEKSCVFGMNMEREELKEIARELGCSVGEFSIPYLGLKVGGRLNGAEGWSGVVEKVKGRIRKWDTKNISMGGRITIVR